jgi:hypothetical protein
MLDQSYPDTFTKRELNEIIKFYDDQRVEYYKFGMRDVREKEDA